MSFLNNSGDPVDPNSNRPFDVHTILGYNSDVPLLNLTVRDNTLPSDVQQLSCIGLATAHILSLHTFDVQNVQKTHTVQHLVGGHGEVIHTLACDSSGRFILTASADALCVWDRKLLINDCPTAIRHLRAPFGPEGSVMLATISDDGKYIIAVGHTDHTDALQLQFWLWSAGGDRPHCVHEMPVAKYGPVSSLVFNPAQV